MTSGLLQRTLLVTAVVGSVLGTSAAVASADPAPCPPSFVLTPPAPGDEGIDRNGNGLICVHQVGGQGGNSEFPGFTTKDDNPSDAPH
jgi:hypothetical protein